MEDSHRDAVSVLAVPLKMVKGLFWAQRGLMVDFLLAPQPESG